MKASILSIGTELTRGEITDTNAPWLAQRLTALGFEVREIACVEDSADRIGDALRRLGATRQVVLVTGGLGPTTDDVTVSAAASVAGVALVRDEAALEALRRRFQTTGRPVTALAERQTEVPEGAEVMGNPAGMAPAFRLRVGEADCYFMPGVPVEMERIFDECVVRRIVAMAAPRSYQIVLRTYGLGESAVGEKLAGLEATLPGLTLGYRVRSPEVDVKVLARADDFGTARALAERAATDARTRLGDAVFGSDDEQYAAAVGRSLRSRGYSLAVAESCTGGLVGAMLTAVPGSSDYLLLDAVVYANAMKERVLRVPGEVLIGHGAVSGECVRAMADGARRIAGSDLAVSVSGVAGPSGGSPEKPVGTVFFALSSARGTEVVERRFVGDRASVQRQAAYAALALVRKACLGPVETLQASVCG
jgi:nicotinamide-nucleotide amidase